MKVESFELNNLIMSTFLFHYEPGILAVQTYSALTKRVIMNRQNFFHIIYLAIISMKMTMIHNSSSPSVGVSSPSVLDVDSIARDDQSGRETAQGVHFRDDALSGGGHAQSVFSWQGISNYSLHSMLFHWNSCRIIFLFFFKLHRKIY